MPKPMRRRMPGSRSSGDAQPIEPEPAFRDRYLRLQPQAADLLALGDFSFYRITPVAIRFIEGFGGIHWVSPAAYAPPDNDIVAIEAECSNT